MLDSPLINSKENSSETVFSRAGAVELASVMLATFSPMFDNIANYMKTRDETLDKHGKKLKGHKKLLKGHEGRLNGCEGQMKGYEERLKRLEGSTFRGRQVVEVAESATRAAKRRSPAAARRKGRAARRARKPRQPAPRKQLNDEQSALLLRVALAHLKPNTYRGAIGTPSHLWDFRIRPLASFCAFLDIMNMPINKD